VFRIINLLQIANARWKMPSHVRRHSLPLHRADMPVHAKDVD